MLLLTRKAGESIIINGDITVKIMRFNRCGYSIQAMIGIEAPSGVTIHREEIQRRIEEEKLFNKICYGDKR